MRSKRTTKTLLRAQIDALRGELDRIKGGGETVQPQAAAVDAPLEELPKIASTGLPLRSSPAAPKTLKEAKNLLMSLREW